MSSLRNQGERGKSLQHDNFKRAKFKGDLIKSSSTCHHHHHHHQLDGS
jgi:hypothetical protein